MTYLTRRNLLRRAATYGGGAVFAPSLAGLAMCGDANGRNAQTVGAPGFPRKAGKGFGGLR